MQCTNCRAEIIAGELFCGECGTPVAAAPQAPQQFNTAPQMAPTVGAWQVAPTQLAPLAAMPPQFGSYSAEISRQNPGCLIFLIDQSGSMNEPIAGGTGEEKKRVVADAVNRLLYNCVLRCTKEDGVRPYFDVGVWTYGGNGVQRAFGTDLVSVRDIAERPLRTEVRQRRVPDGAGGVYEEEFQLPVWFDPVGSGTTPMHAAFSSVVAPLQAWINQHQRSFSPIVINLTDGVYSDATPAPVAWNLMSLCTSDGNLLLFNCHISKQGGAVVPFPNDAQAAGLEGFARELYDISSPLPPPMSRLAQAKGYQLEQGARGYAFNADLVTMIDFLDIGTRAVQDRMEKV